jgi:hypothetical protein
MKAKYDNLNIIYINDENGFNEITAPIILKIIKSNEPAYFEFLIPNSFFVYYKAAAQTQKAYDSLLAEIKNLIDRDDRFEDTRVGMAKGKMIVQTDWLGRIKSAPLGEPGNDAMTNIIFSRRL